jgi:hypothetical protein
MGRLALEQEHPELELAKLGEISGLTNHQNLSVASQFFE